MECQGVSMRQVPVTGHPCWFPRHFEDRDLHRLRHFRATREPLGVSPALQHGLGVGATFVRKLLDVVKGVKHQQGFFQCIGCDLANLRVVKHFDKS